jgi:hypothetical protein
MLWFRPVTRRVDWLRLVSEPRFGIPGERNGVEIWLRSRCDSPIQTLRPVSGTGLVSERVDSPSTPEKEVGVGAIMGWAVPKKSVNAGAAALQQKQDALV